MKLRLGELFCGPGGLAVGALKSSVTSNRKKISISHEWSNDYHMDTCETYRHNISPKKPNSVICDDVRRLDIKKLSPIDLFAYGFPCNDFSNVGERKGLNGEFGPLYSYGVDVLEYHQPKAFVAENVGGLTTSTQKSAFERILSELKGAGPGYELTAHLYKFEEYGIPQTRHRVIIVGINKELNCEYSVPSPTHGKDLKPFVTCKSVIDRPIPNGTQNTEHTRQNKKVIERLSHIKPGENAWTADLPSHLQLNVKGAKLSQIYKRLDPNKPAYTITGSGGGGTHGYHWKENRALTNRERARIQTFPDKFEFLGSKESVRRQIGMAVSPDMSEIIFTALLKSLYKIDYDHIESNLNILS